MKLSQQNGFGRQLAFGQLTDDLQPMQLAMMLPAKPTHLERLVVVVMVNLRAAAAYLARLALQLASFHVNMRVSPRVHLFALLPIQRVSFTPFAHLSIGARGTITV
jgi:hypothetical protein